ncbi:hypothetical protein ECHHL_0078 [Ehrlichia chaffeensis str. Heartland]|uniref:hypothetical protein n=1 Tax=Ehrlichia chaffeensis TaxID=945 RepID=UPI000053A225|nr:hypothetical protein [Ehrlichia chaffeensis]AHX03255.1 hypothetical protein ECHHL_0078 [Ehrlichia chaffeensis str. Heartland]AHX05171.1 hypothetical protein ECHJAX_0078 [Ehrlichia chaffeensis str. Jax]AHX06160.1 hypothetical protein ECHLIB_0078 [Ehrlichia chaffeensis str. Liberty]AHX07945.1 hypothetical protein ECHOSC_0079 [Ehrlichia chaffeensis str. Osceola]AHX08099.1 hypothetical protein ECHSTV_0078 [Ehrlichia chaffeensis str. Saint Vincent]
MISNIIISDNSSITIFFTGKDEIEKFTKIFTVLDKNKAAKALFNHEVNIEYQDNRAILTSSTNFEFSDLNKIITHMLQHDFIINTNTIEQSLEQGCNTLKTDNLVICRFNDKPLYSINISIRNNTIILHPISTKYLDLSSEYNQKLMSLLKTHTSTSDITIDNKQNSILLSINTAIYDIIQSLVSTLIKAQITEESDKEKILQQLTKLAFHDFTSNELQIVKNIALYPTDHPLSKYKNIAKNVENIFSHLASNQLLDSYSVKLLQDAINNTGEFSTAPHIIMRSFSKLNKNFYDQVQSIINQAQ